VYDWVVGCPKQFVAPVDAQLGALAEAALNSGSSFLHHNLMSTALQGDRIMGENISGTVDIASQHAVLPCKTEGGHSNSSDSIASDSKASDTQKLVSRERVEQMIWLGGVWVRKFKLLKKRNLSEGQVIAWLSPSFSFCHNYEASNP
jgi:hypothetical protein